MAAFSDEVVIQRPLPEVFAMASDLRRAPEWLPAITRVERIGEADDAPLRVGSRWKETRLMGKRECAAEIEVAAYRGPEDTGPTGPCEYAARAAAMGVEAVYHYSFEADGPDATRVRLDATTQGRNLVGKLFAPMMLKAMKKQDGDQLQALKGALEA